MILNDDQLAERRKSPAMNTWEWDYLDTIADLKRQLRQALAQVEIVDRALGDPGNTSSKVALAAYVQEAVDAARAKAFEQCRQLLLAQGSDVCANGAAIFAGWRDDAAKVKT